MYEVYRVKNRERFSYGEATATIWHYPELKYILD